MKVCYKLCIAALIGLSLWSQLAKASSTGAVRRLYFSTMPILRQSAHARPSQSLLDSSRALKAPQCTRFLTTPSRQLQTGTTPVETGRSSNFAQSLLQALHEARQARRHTYFSEGELQRLKQLTDKDWGDINRYAEVVTGDFNKDKTLLILGGKSLETEADYRRWLQKFVPDYLISRKMIDGRYETYLEYAQRLLQPCAEVEQQPLWQAYYDAAHAVDEPEGCARVIME